MNDPGSIEFGNANYTKKEARRGDVPNTDTENQLIVIWSDVLKVDNLCKDDDFFDLGGTSLVALELIDAIENHFRQTLALSLLIECSTIRLLTDYIESHSHDTSASAFFSSNYHGDRTHQFNKSSSNQNQDSTYGSLITLQKGTQDPLIFVPGGNGDELGITYQFVNLVKLFNSSQSILAFRARGTDGLLPQHKSVDELVHDYITELQDIQPIGPYRIIGFCRGGYIALELARALKRKNEEVDTVILFDTPPPTNLRSSFIKQNSKIYQLKSKLIRKLNYYSKLLSRVKHHAQSCGTLNPIIICRLILDKSKLYRKFYDGEYLKIAPFFQANPHLLEKSGKAKRNYKALTVESAARVQYNGKVVITANSQWSSTNYKSYWENTLTGSVEILEYGDRHSGHIGHQSESYVELIQRIYEI